MLQCLRRLKLMAFIGTRQELTKRFRIRVTSQISHDWGNDSGKIKENGAEESDIAKVRALLEELSHALLAGWVDGGQDLVGICACGCHQLLGRCGHALSSLALQGRSLERLHDESEDAVGLGEDSRVLPVILLARDS